MGLSLPNPSFDIDRYLNRIIPRNHVHHLPKPVSWFLGYRKSKPAAIGNVLVWWWAFIGAFAGILVVEAVFQTKALQAEGTPIVIASLGAAAILEFNTIDTPLAQPRNAILGQILSAVVGIGITKLFQHSSHFESLRWVAGALSVGVSSALMGITKTVHPPAGATALLCSTTPEITALGWFLLPLIILGSSLLVAVACVLNNIQRQFPIYWWTPEDLSPKSKEDIENVPLEKEHNSDRDYVETSATISQNRIVIDMSGNVLPDWLQLEVEEQEMLEILTTKLREGQGLAASRSRESDKTQVE